MVELQPSKLITGVRFPSPAPLLELPEHLNSSVRYKKFIILDIMDFFHAWKEVKLMKVSIEQLEFPSSIKDKILKLKDI